MWCWSVGLQAKGCPLEGFKRKIKHLAKLSGDSVLTSFRELVSTWYTLASRIEIQINTTPYL
jgi:hypothetical protein